MKAIDELLGFNGPTSDEMSYFLIATVLVLTIVITIYIVPGPK